MADAESSTRRTARGSGSSAGLRNCRLEHIIGFPTDESALRRLPLARAAAAIVSADVDSADVDTQITDSEVITSAHQLRSLYEQQRAAEYIRRRRRGEAVDPHKLHLIVEFNDVLTKKLLERRPDLLHPRDEETSLSRYGLLAEDTALLPEGMQFVDVVTFHRNCLETAGLSISAHSSESWYAMKRLLDGRVGIDLVNLPVASLLEPDELEQTVDDETECEPAAPAAAPAPPPAAAPASAPAPAPEVAPLIYGPMPQPGLSFHELEERLAARGLGVLVGWRRLGDHANPFAEAHVGLTINPDNKASRVLWQAHDLLLLLAHKSEGHERLAC